MSSIVRRCVSLCMKRFKCEWVILVYPYLLFVNLFSILGGGLFFVQCNNILIYKAAKKQKYLGHI